MGASQGAFRICGCFAFFSPSLGVLIWRHPASPGSEKLCQGLGFRVLGFRVLGLGVPAMFAVCAVGMPCTAASTRQGWSEPHTGAIV